VRRAEIPFEVGLKRTIEWYKENIEASLHGESDHC